MDSFKGVEPALETQQVDVLKINREELLALMKSDSLEQAASNCLLKYDIRYLAITDGPKVAHLFIKDAQSSVPVVHYMYRIPEISNVINPIGAGDTASAIFFAHLLQGVDARSAWKKGLAAASASCLQLDLATFSDADAKDIESKIIEEKITS
eukprot:TRINITY_DN9664_c0_g1_i1.p1 TRINITY_DN9664_c0_g1~~TRINITY_DN9664_c0_g1_i1.p1  ORF type:complete len:153 (-),score=46.74 TRINITY_DN9664_c0_g1_i1:7-465(-)